MPEYLRKLILGDFWKHTELLTGGSFGGVLGGSFFRRIFRSLKDPAVNPVRRKVSDQISADNLNRFIFSLLVNDLLIRNQYYGIWRSISYLKKIGGLRFRKFNLYQYRSILDKPLIAYQDSWNSKGEIPTYSSYCFNPLMTGGKLVTHHIACPFLELQATRRKLGFAEKKTNSGFSSILLLMTLKIIPIFNGPLRMSFDFPFSLPQISSFLPKPLWRQWIRGFSDNFGDAGWVWDFSYVFQNGLQNNHFWCRHDHDSWFREISWNPTNSASKDLFKSIYSVQEHFMPMWD